MAKKKATTKSEKKPAKKSAPQQAASWEPACLSRFSKADMEVIGPALMELHNSGVGITVSSVLAAAKDPGHPLHKYLHGVDDAVKRAEWLRHKAGEIIRSVNVVFVYRNDKDEEKKCKTRAFVCLAEKRYATEEVPEQTIREHLHVPLTALEDRPDYLDQVLERYTFQLEAFDRRTKWFRDKYPELADQMNAAIKALYDKYATTEV